MKIDLPNGNSETLDNSLTIEEKIKLVNLRINEWQEYIELFWLTDDCRFFLEKLANYLIWHKEDDNPENYEDKEVMSKNKTDRLIRGQKEIPFSCLSKTDKKNIDSGEQDGI